MKLFSLSSLTGKLILLSTILASGMTFLDSTVVGIAIPSIQKGLNADISGIQWIVNSYTLMLATLILISGSLCDRFGTKKIFLIGMFLFTISSLLCGLSFSIGQLIVFRAIQGIGGAMMVPGSLSIITTSFDSREHGKVIGLWSGISGGVAALGPLMGGYLVQVFNWPSIFFINIPLGILAIFLTIKYIPSTKFHEGHKLDFVGTFLIFFALLGVAYGLISGPVSGWSNTIVEISLVGGLMCFILFVVSSFKMKNPLVPLEIFKSPLVTGANLATLFLYFALSGVIFFVVLNLQQIQHFSPISAGLGLLPTILIITFLSGPAGALADKTGPRIPMILGPATVAIGMAFLSFAGRNINYFTQILPGLILFGLGMSFVIAPLTKSALSVEPKYSGSASGVNNAVARVAGLLAVAILGAIVLSIFTNNLSGKIYASNLSNDEKIEILNQKNDLGGITIPKNFSENSKNTTQNIIEDSFVYGFKWAMGICAFLAFISAVISFAAIKNPKN
ncbi:MAG TPA: MFS transporter [Candidatus Sulfotelmatobacter sp.]|nr:MFS transporter [Candidatus Sulfotelmatobacter sp.]